MLKNLIFLTEADLEKSIYRIFSFQRLQEIFTQKKLTLVRPSMWDDPFENFILRAQATVDGGTPFNIASRNHHYGQCWSRTKESDAMWRIYSPDKEGVKVKTTIAKLFRPLFEKGGSFRDIHDQEYNLQSFIGKVKYQSQKSLTAMLDDTIRMNGKIMDQSGWGQASSFYFKRWAFKHENEVRLIFRDDNNVDDLIHFDIDPIELFDEIVLDPRMSTDDVNYTKRELRSWGYQKKVMQSGLYKVRTFDINLSI
ncbi:DUF2971 domain-containing protein [Pedobacter frigidisoli]|uniref:DUF2971 domain-containing protein n=1 Tax=Pedobacter frigidisoli TaxID=2530455 RepID=UPI0029313275|nr:DUF2971 domain-containing protein [Pedobacter frigidisoli]